MVTSWSTLDFNLFNMSLVQSSGTVCAPSPLTDDSAPFSSSSPPAPGEDADPDGEEDEEVLRLFRALPLCALAAAARGRVPAGAKHLRKLLNSNFWRTESQSRTCFDNSVTLPASSSTAVARSSFSGSIDGGASPDSQTAELTHVCFARLRKRLASS